MSGQPGWFEIGVPDGARAQAFWGALLPWRFTAMGGASASIETASVPGGLHDGDASAAITLYFDVTDIDASVRTVRELGGTAEDAAPEQPGFGRYASCRDDQGVAFGLHQAPSNS